MEDKDGKIKDYMPETRTWIMVGLFALTFYIFHMLESQPTLQDNKLFFGLATLIVGTFFGGAVGFYFGSSQSSTNKSATIDTLANQMPKIATQAESVSAEAKTPQT